MVAASDAKVADFMTTEIFAVSSDTSLETAARIMTSNGLSGLPVIGRGGRPHGVVTLTDIADPDRPKSERDGYPLFYRVSGKEMVELGDHVSVAKGRVGDVMSAAILSIESTATLAEAAARMSEAKVHRLLVTAGSVLVGIITTADITRAMGST